MVMKKMLTFVQDHQATPNLCDPIDSDHETSISSTTTQRCEIATESIGCSGLDTKGPSQYEKKRQPAVWAKLRITTSGCSKRRAMIWHGEAWDRKHCIWVRKRGVQGEHHHLLLVCVLAITTAAHKLSSGILVHYHTGYNSFLLPLLPLLELPHLDTACLSIAVLPT